MLYMLALAVHITIACVTFASCAYVAYAVLTASQKWFTQLSLLIALCALIETCTGFMLAVLSSEATPERVISHLVFYLSICLLTEVAIVLEQKRVWIG